MQKGRMISKLQSKKSVEMREKSDLLSPLTPLNNSLYTIPSNCTF